MTSIINIINEEISSMMDETYNHANYLKWKRQNVTLRGVTDRYAEDNGGSAMLGRGLYSAFLSNKQMARQYGKVYFLLNAIPKHPKVFNTLNDWEIWEYNTMITNYLKARGINDLSRLRETFEKLTSISAEMQRLGYDGVVIKGREMVNYTPPDNVKYFENERQLMMYYEDFIENN